MSGEGDGRGVGGGGDGSWPVPRRQSGIALRQIPVGRREVPEASVGSGKHLLPLAPFCSSVLEPDLQVHKKEVAYYEFCIKQQQQDESP